MKLGPAAQYMLHAVGVRRTLATTRAPSKRHRSRTRSGGVPLFEIRIWS